MRATSAPGGAGAARAAHGHALPRAPAGNEAPPPTSGTGVEMTIHWLRGGFDQPEADVLELVNELTEGGYGETLPFGRFMYGRQHRFVGGLTVFTEPRAENMPPVMLECPGTACEFLGLEKLRTLFCNAQLSRVDVAFDHTIFAPTDVADWVRAGNVRTRAKKVRLDVKIMGPASEGDKLTVGSRASEQYLRVYDRRGFTRMELELKGDMARSYRDVLLASDEVFRRTTVGVLRQFVDFVDASSEKNISRAPLLPVWELFTGHLDRVRLRASGAVQPSVERIVQFIEHQVAATLFAYCRLGYSMGTLLANGKKRLKSRHRSLLSSQGVAEYDRRSPQPSRDACLADGATRQGRVIR